MLTWIWIIILLLAALWLVRFVRGFYRGLCEGITREICSQFAAAIRRVR